MSAIILSFLNLDDSNQSKIQSFIFKVILASQSTSLFSFIVFILINLKEYMIDEKTRYRVAFLIATYTKTSDHFIDQPISYEMVVKCTCMIQNILKIKPTETTPHLILNSIEKLYGSYR